MSGTELHYHLHRDPTQYARYAAPGAEAYSETVGQAEPAVQRWPRVLMVAGLVVLTAFLLALLTLQMVMVGEPAGPAPSGVVTRSVTTTVISESQGAQTASTTVSVVPTGASRPPVTTAVTIPEPPPATMTNPLEPPPATMTNPLEPPPATMTNPLEPPPATMTNPLEPPPVGSAD